ncbi:hypothetical protein [Fictibacillus sp. FJAT-27399]|uniref:hypothetical protein n=1 Tax=Fictibacillus sp. FJAT-27399 TaxID=1729689 RepID=UPI0012E385CB|nr:hypothetical protein [Fictibacillus sp. FJAT-27399]
MISVSGCSLSAGRAMSPSAQAPKWSHLSRSSRWSLAPSTPINFSMKILLQKCSQSNIILEKSLQKRGCPRSL